MREAPRGVTGARQYWTVAAEDNGWRRADTDVGNTADTNARAAMFRLMGGRVEDLGRSPEPADVVAAKRDAVCGKRGVGHDWRISVTRRSTGRLRFW